MTYMDPEFRTILDKNNVIVQTSGGQGGIGTDYIGNGRYAVTLPDGQQVIVDQHGNIIG